MKSGIILGFIVLIAGTSAAFLKKEKDVPPQHHVVDRTSNPTLHHVIERTPTVTAITSKSPIPHSPPAPTYMSFGNNNDNNGPDPTAANYGKAPEIVGPAIYVHSKGKLAVVQETPAHVGNRHETKTITSLNKETGKY